MTDCERLSDRMPEVSLGRASWMPDEARHLASCESCRAEWELLAAAHRVGAGAPLVSASPELAAGLLRRLAAEPVPAPRRAAVRWGAGLAVAAGLALAVWTTMPRDPGRSSDAVAGADTSELLDTAQLLVPLDEGLAPSGPSTLDLPDLSDLNADELERVLRTWEG